MHVALFWRGCPALGSPLYESIRSHRNETCPPRPRASRALAAVAATVALAAAGFIAAPSASATSVTITLDAQYQPDVTSVGIVQTITIVNNGSATVQLSAQSGKLEKGSTQADCSSSANCAVASGASIGFNVLVTSEFVFMVTENGQLKASIAVNAPPAPAAAPASAPAVVADFSLGGGAEGCTDGATSGMTGEWMTLPSKCSAPAGHDGAALLGWSTSADFPVAIAQRQADNKWGTYEQTDADGNVTAVFIPAGWGTFVSGSNTLYPVWTK